MLKDGAAAVAPGYVLSAEYSVKANTFDSGADVDIVIRVEAKSAKGRAALKTLVPEVAAVVNDLGIGSTMLLRDKKGGDMSEWEPALRVREFPGTQGENP
jgi:hypothetical protein